MKIIKSAAAFLFALIILSTTAFAGYAGQSAEPADAAVNSSTGLDTAAFNRDTEVVYNPGLSDRAEDYIFPEIDAELFAGQPAAGAAPSLAVESPSGMESSLAASARSSFNKLPLSFQVTDSAYDPVKPVVYLTDKENMQLYALNYSTGESTSLSLQYTPESLVFANGEIYVSLLISGHQYYGSTESGAVAIVDPDTMTLKEQFPVNIDPYDIEADSNYFYITSGSNQWTQMRSYSRASKLEVSHSGIRAWSYGKLNPVLNKMYTIDTDSSPRDFRAYNLLNGVFTDNSYPGGYDSPYHGDYSMSANFRISPDGKYLFNGAGTIFHCDLLKANDMRYMCTLDSRFSDIAFDIQNNIFYTAAANKLIAMYDYDKMQRIGEHFIEDTVISLNLSGDILAAVCKDEQNVFFVESLASPGANMSPVAENGVKGAVMLSGIITGIKYDTARNKAYAVDNALYHLYVIDLSSRRVEQTVELTYCPADLCISEDGQKLYIVNHHDSIMATEIDIATLTVTRNLTCQCTDWGEVAVVHRHIYEQGNRLYIVGGEWGPKLYVFDTTTFARIQTTSISEVGGMGFAPDSSSLFYWRQYGWSAGNLASDIYKYSISGEAYTLQDQAGLIYPDFQRDPLDTPLLVLPNKGTIICKKYELDMTNLKNIVHTFPEEIYAVNSDETTVVGKQNIYIYDSQSGVWTSTPLIAGGSVESLFFAGGDLMSLSKTGSGIGSYFIEKIWTGQRHYITGNISLSFGVKAPPEGLQVQISAYNGEYSQTTTLSMEVGMLPFIIYNLPALSGYTLSYTIINGTNGKTADDYGFQAYGYYNVSSTVADENSATPLDLTLGSKTANISLIGNRTISGVVALPDGDTAPEGGLQLLMVAANQCGDLLVPVMMPPGAASVPFSLNVPSTTPVYGYNIACYQGDERYLVACGYSDTGTVPQKKFSNDISVTSGNRNGIDLTLIKAELISGMVFLPQGEVAKAGGLAVDVFANNGEFNTYTSITIPSGASSAAYELSVPKAVKSTVSLRINAFGDNGNEDYSFNNSNVTYIPNGPVSSDYTISYNLSAGSGYQTTGYYSAGPQSVSTNAAKVNIGAGGVGDVNLTILKGTKTISGNIVLPTGMVAPAGGLNVFVVAANNALDFETAVLVTVPQGSSMVNYSIGVPALAGYNLYYYVDENRNPGYVPYGYYAGTQTLVERSKALTINTSINSVSSINLKLMKGIAVSGIITVPASPVDINMVVAIWNEYFEIDKAVTIRKSLNTQSIPYTVYVPASYYYCAQYVITSQLDGYLKQGFYNNGYGSDDYITANSIILVQSAAISNIGFNLIPAVGMITGCISLPDGTGASPYYIYVPTGSAKYEIYYRLLSTSTVIYQATGYFPSYVYLSSGFAVNIDFALLPSDSFVQIQALTAYSASLYLENDAAGTVVVAIYDLNGRMLSIGAKSIPVQAGLVSISLSGFTAPDIFNVVVFLMDGSKAPVYKEFTETYTS